MISSFQRFHRRFRKAFFCRLDCFAPNPQVLAWPQELLKVRCYFYRFFFKGTGRVASWNRKIPWPTKSASLTEFFLRNLFPPEMDFMFRSARDMHHRGLESTSPPCPPPERRPLLESTSADLHVPLRFVHRFKAQQPTLPPIGADGPM